MNGTGSPPRPELSAHREALRLPIDQLVKELCGLIGRKLTAYIAGLRDVRALDRLACEEAPSSEEVQGKLRLAYELAKTIAEVDSPAIAQAWLIGLNPELGDRVPIQLLREGDLSIVSSHLIGAMRAYVAS